MKYQLTIAKLPFAKEIDEFAFTHTPINETLVRDLAGGGFLASQRNLVLVGGTGSGKTHLAVGIARACIRSPPHAAGVPEPAGRLGVGDQDRTGTPGRRPWPLLQCRRSGRRARRRGASQPPPCRSGGRTADHLCRLDPTLSAIRVILDELGYLPFAQTGGQLLFHLISRLYEHKLGHRHHQPDLRRLSRSPDRAPFRGRGKGLLAFAGRPCSATPR